MKTMSTPKSWQVDIRNDGLFLIAFPVPSATIFQNPTALADETRRTLVLPEGWQWKPGERGPRTIQIQVLSESVTLNPVLVGCDMTEIIRAVDAAGEAQIAALLRKL